MGAMVPVAVWAVTVSLRGVASSTWVVASSMLDVVASVHDVQVLRGLSHPLCGML